MTMDEKYPLALPEGTVLAGQYVIEKVLGQGGFGITYRATDHKTNQKVAVKEFFPDTLAYREMTTVTSYPGERSENYVYGKESFLQEAKTLAEFIGNENIVRIHSYFEENGTAYFVMDYIEGKSFDEYIKERGGKISVEEAKKILIPVMDALNVVHSKGIVHRDVTPDNIYITNDGTVKLLDFGAARYSLGDKSRSLDVILKHGFAPKEQYTRRGKQGPYTDIYSLAATFYFAITGKRPPDSVERLDEDDLIPPSNLGVDITDYQETAILQALSVQPSDRFVSMAVFKKVLLNESIATNQVFFTAPEAAVAPIVQQAAPAVQQGTLTLQAAQSAQQAAASVQTVSLMQTGREPEKGKKKKLVIGLSAAGAACVLVVVFLVVHAFSNNGTPSSTSAGSGNSSYASDGGGSSSNTTPSQATHEPATLEPATPKPATQEPITPEPVTYNVSELTVVGNTAANIKNTGIYTANGSQVFWIDERYRSLMMSGSEYIYQNQDKEFSCLSYYDGILYFLYNGKAYMRNMTDGSAEILIPQLESYDEYITSLYVTTGCYFIYTDGKLYRISRKTGEEEEWIAISSYDNISFYDGWLYYIDEDADGYSIIYRVAADNFNIKGGYNISSKNGKYTDPVVTEQGIFVLWHSNSDSGTAILRLDPDLSNVDNQNTWFISELVNADGINDGSFATQLNAIGYDLFFSIYSAVSDTYSLYRVIGNKGYDSDIVYELISSDYALYPCITGSEENYKVHFFDYDEEDDMMELYYKTYN